MLRFRRQNRQLVQKRSERTYKLGELVVAKNRKARCGQQKVPSLEQYRIELEAKVGVLEARRTISRCRVRPSTVSENNMKRVLPGAIFQYQGRCYLLKGTTAKKYYTAVDYGKKRFPMRDCKIVVKNKGLIFFKKVLIQNF